MQEEKPSFENTKLRKNSIPTMASRLCVFTQDHKEYRADMSFLKQPFFF